jgi:hypothetical protein
MFESETIKIIKKNKKKKKKKSINILIIDYFKKMNFDKNRIIIMIMVILNIVF